MARELCAQQAGKSSGTRVLRQLVQFWQLSCAAHGDHRVPAVDKINDHIDKKADPLIQKIDALSERVARLEGPLTKRVSGLETRLNQQASLAKLIDPRRVLATIRAEIQTAETSGKLLPASDLSDYKNAVRALPTSAYEYWTTMAAPINPRLIN